MFHLRLDADRIQPNLASTESPSSVRSPGSLDAEPADSMKGSSGSPSAITDPGSFSLFSSLPSSTEKASVIITKDEDYFMEGAFMVFQVENCLFRVPSYLFSKESEIFGDMFRLPQPYYPNEKGDIEGSSSESNPIILPAEFAKADFRCLLKALYPLSFTLRLHLPKEDWLAILKLSTKWYFLDLRQTAIFELKDVVSSLEEITYGRKYRISSWATSGFVDLVKREASISDDEALDIDAGYPTTAYRLFRTRERRIRGFFRGNVTSLSEIELQFKSELYDIRADERAYEFTRVKSPPYTWESTPDSPAMAWR